MFQYNISSDNAEVKKLRDQLGIDGVYFSIDSDKDLCSKFPKYTVFSAIDSCLFRLLGSIASLENSGNKLSDNSVLENAYIQLIWEAESVLPKELDDDNNIKNARFFLNLCVKFLPALDKKVVERSILAYLSIWKRYTARFQNSKALDMAISSLEPVNLFSF